MDIQTKRTTRSKLEEVDLDNLGFGEVFSDHMFMLDYRDSRWQSSRILPFGTIEVSPSLCTLHYGQAVFEGLKAFYRQDGTISLFRPALRLQEYLLLLSLRPGSHKPWLQY